MGLSPSASGECQCGATDQTAQHIVQLAARPAVCRIELLNQTQEEEDHTSLKNNMVSQLWTQQHHQNLTQYCSPVRDPVLFM